MNSPARRTGALVRCLPPGILAVALLAVGRRTGALVLGCVALALLVLGVVAPSVTSGFDRALKRLAHGVASAVSFGLAGAGWVLLVLPVWGINRVRSMLRRTRPSDLGSAWLSVAPGQARQPDGTPSHANRSGSLDDSGATRSPLVTLFVVVALVGLLTASLVVVGRRLGLDATIATRIRSGGGSGTSQTDGGSGAVEWDGLPVDGYAHEDEPWAREFFRELNQLPVESDFFLGDRLRDFEGRYLRVVDGHRVSYTPKDPEITVWFFGGSTMFGIGQRDDHTLPSVIARAAEADGIRIRAVNFGVSAFANWQSLEQFEQLLTSGVEPPDLAVFYEGINEWSLGNERVALGDARPGSISRLALSEDEREKVRSASDNVGAFEWGKDRSEVVVKLAADQYRRGSLLIDALARSYGVPVARAWQPSPFAKRPKPSDDELWRRLDFDASALPSTTSDYNRSRIESGVDVIDLTTVLDDVDRPVYFDGGHTNELGARIIGEALYRRLQPDLLRAWAQR